MAKIILAKNAGFCFGVKRAIDSALECLEKYNKIYTYGDIIHNKDVVNMLHEKGAITVESIDGLHDINLLIRSHGVPKSIYKYCEDNNINIIDNTCPYVKKVQKMVKDKDECVIIIGEKTHPEIIGVKGWAGDNSIIVNSIEEAQNIPEMDTCIVVCQTTLEKQHFDDIVETIKTRVNNPVIHNTICNATNARQQEALLLAQQCDAMIVIGGKHSSNTKKLYNICKLYCKNVYFIENVSQLPLEITKNNAIIGVVAGASTPDWIIREVLTTMSENTNTNMEQEMNNLTEKDNQQIVEDEGNFYADLEKSLRTIRTNEIVSGTVVQVSNNEIFVDIEYKSDGIIPRNEYTNDSSVVLTEVVKVGDKINAQVLKLNNGEGNVLLSVKKIANKQMWNDLENKFKDADAVYTVTGKETVNGGIVADLDGVKVFIPASLIDLKFVKDLSQFVGKTFDIKVIEFDKAKKKIIGSRKVLLEEQSKKAKEEIWSKFEAKQEVEGVVRRITDFGAFVDIGGVDGLLHVADIAWYRIGHPSDVLKVGDKVKVLILSINKEKERISLGLKQLQAKPWETVENKYAEGQVVKGKVVRILEFGAFIELEPGIDGLVHISQIALKHVDKVDDELKIGDEVEAKIISVDVASKKISLSIKQLLKDNMPKEEVVEEVIEETFVPEITESSVSISEFFEDGFLDELQND